MVQQQWFPNEIEFLASWAFKATEKGWINNEVALWWCYDPTLKNHNAVHTLG
jgi:hypothetical protein